MSTSRLDDIRMVDPVLTTIAQGYSNAAFVADKLFPHVSVSKLKGKIPVFGKEAFVIRETERAIRAQSNRIPPSDITLTPFETRERDIEIALDYIEEEESPDFYRLEQRISKELSDILALGKEKEAADYSQNPANYITDLKHEITEQEALNDFDNDTDPILVIRTAMSAIRGKIARYPNTMIIGDSVFQVLMQHTKIIERIKYGGVSAPSVKLLSDLTGVPEIGIGLSVYSSDGSTFADVWGDSIILAYVDKNDRQSRSEFNPSYGYTFQREGKPEIDTYYENGGKIKVIRCTDNYGIKVTATDAAYLIYNAIH